MSLVVFDKPVHPVAWKRPPGSLDYRVTGSFYGVDLVNGGVHEATDAGNGQTGHPVLAPADCRARGLRNYSRNGTDALGLEFDLGGGYRLQLWHLGQTLPVADENKPPGQNSYGSWRDVRRGEVVGRTGNSGALVGGKAMPAHTHIRLELNGVPIDPEPYLLGRAALPMLDGSSIQEDDVIDPTQIQPWFHVTVLSGGTAYLKPDRSAVAQRAWPATEIQHVGCYGLPVGASVADADGKVIANEPSGRAKLVPLRVEAAGGKLQVWWVGADKVIVEGIGDGIGPPALREMLTAKDQALDRIAAKVDELAISVDWTRNLQP